MNAELDRMKRDLEIINEASGLGLPPLGREDAQALGLLGAVGLAIAAWSWLAGGLPPESIALLGTVVSLGGVLFYHFIYTRRGMRTPASDRGSRWSWRLGLLLGTLIGGFYVWAKFFGGLQGSAFAAVVFIFSGSLLVLLAWTDKWRLCFLGWAVPLLMFGAFVPLMPPTLFVTLLGATLGVGGLASAAIVHFQLKAHAHGTEEAAAP